MHNCIFSAHCTEDTCDQACPILAETSYLLERNNITFKSPVFKMKDTTVDICNEHLHRLETNDRFIAVDTSDTVGLSDCLTYCAICQNWKGSQLHCTVYHLRYGKYLETMKASWNRKSESAQLEYMRIFSESASILIVSGLDYVNFKDFESQTLLALLQSRDSDAKSTIVVVPTNSILGNGLFYERLKLEISEAKNRQ